MFPRVDSSDKRGPENLILNAMSPSNLREKQHMGIWLHLQDPRNVT